MSLAWQDHAACRHVGGDMFFPGKGEHDMVRPAKRVCARCPVQLLCLDWAMATEPPEARFGVFGGLTATERHRLAARQQREVA